jgi:predicted GNAT family acetyltransferase
MPAPNSVVNNPAENRFELNIDGKLSVVEYAQRGEFTLALTHTEVHPDLEGHGVGSRLVSGVFDYVRAHHLNVIPLCPFVTAYLRRHLSDLDVVHPAYRKQFETS